MALEKHVYIVEEVPSSDLVAHLWNLFDKWIQKLAKYEAVPL